MQKKKKHYKTDLFLHHLVANHSQFAFLWLDLNIVATEVSNHIEFTFLWWNLSIVASKYFSSHRGYTVHRAAISGTSAGEL